MKILILLSICATLWLNTDALWGRDRNHDAHGHGHAIGIGHGHGNGHAFGHGGKVVLGHLGHKVQIGSQVLGKLHGLFHKGGNEVKDWFLQLREANPRFVEGSPDYQKLITWLNYYFGSSENLNNFVQSPQFAQLLQIIKRVGGLDKPEDVISLHLLLSRISGRPVLNYASQVQVQPQQVIFLHNDYNTWLQSPVGQDLLLKIRQINPAITSGPGWQQLLILLRHYFPSTKDLENFVRTPNFNVFLQFLPSLGGDLQTQPQNTQTIINYLQQITGRPAADVQQLLLTQLNQQQQIQVVQRPTQVLVQRPPQFVIQPTSNVDNKPSIQVTRESPLELWLQTPEGQQLLTFITSVNPSFKPESPDMIRLLSVIKHYFPTAGDILTLANPKNSPVLLNYIKQLGNRFGANPSALGDLNKYLKGLSKQPLVYFEELGPKDPQTSQNTIHLSKLIFGDLSKTVKIGSHILGDIHGLLRKGVKDVKDWLLQLRETNPRFVEGSPDQQKLISWLNYYFGSPENVNTFVQSPQSAEVLKILKGVGGLDKPEDVISLHLLLSKLSGRPVLNEGPIQVVQPSTNQQIIVVQNDYNKWLQSPVGQDLLLKIQQTNPAIATGPGSQQLISLLRHYFPSTTDLEKFIKTPNFNVFLQFLPSLGGNLQTQPQNTQTIITYLQQITGRPAPDVQQLQISPVKEQQPIQVVQRPTQVLVQRPPQFVIQPTSNVDNKPSIQVTRESPLELWLQTPEGQQLLTSITSVNPSFKPESPDMIRLLSVIKHYFPTAGDILTLANPKNSPVLLNYIKQLGNRFGANPSALGDLNKYLKGLSKQPLVYFEELGPKDPQTSQNTIHLSKLIFGDLSKTVKIGSHILGDIHGLLRKGVKDVKDWLLQLRETNPRFVEGSPDQQKLISWLNYYFGSPENVNTFVQSPQSAEVLKILKGVGGLDKPEDVISLHLLLSKLSGRPVLNEGPIQVVQPSTNQQIIVVQNDYNKWLQSPVGQDLLLKIQQTNPAIATGPGSQQLISLLRHYFPSTTDLEKFIKTPNFNVFLQFLPSLGGNLQTQPQNTQTIITYLQQITGRPAPDVQQLQISPVKEQQPIQVVQRPTQVLVQRPPQFVIQPTSNVDNKPSIQVTRESPLELWLQTPEGQQLLTSITSVNPSFKPESPDMIRLLSVIKHYFPTAGDILTLANPKNSPVLLNYIKQLGNRFGANPSALGDLNKYLKGLSKQPLVYFEELGPKDPQTSQNTIHLSKLIFGDLSKTVKIGSHILGDIHGLLRKGVKDVKDWLLQLRETNPRFVEGSPDQQKLISWLNYYFGSPENVNTFVQSPQSAEVLKILKGVGGLDKPEDVISLHLLLSKLSGRPVLNEGPIQVVQPSTNQQIIVVQNDYNKWLQSPVGQDLLLKIQQTNPAIATGPGSQQLISLLRHYFPSTTDLEKFIKTPNFNVFLQFLPSLGGNLQTQPQNTQTIITYLQQITGRPAPDVQQLQISPVKEQQPIQVVQRPTQVLVQRPPQFVIQPTSNVDNKPSIQVTRESPLELWLQTPEGQQLLTSITSVNPSFKPESPDMIRLLSVIKHYFPTAGDILTLANPKNSPVLLNYIKQLGNRFGANPSALGDLNKYLKGLSKQPLVYFEELGPKDPQTSQNTIHLSKLIFGDLSKTVKIGSHILGDIHGLLRKGVKDVKDWLLQLRETNPRFVEGSPDQQKLISWLNYYFGSPENVNTFVQSPQSAEVLKILKGVGGLDKPEDVISLHLLLSKLSGRPVLNEGPIQVVQPSTNQQIIVVQNDYNKWLQSPVGQDLLLKIQQTNPAIATGPGSQQLISLLRHYFPSTTDLEKFIKTPNFNVFLQFLPSLGGNLQTQPQNTQTIITYLQQITGRPAPDVQQLQISPVKEQQPIQVVQRPTQVLVQRPPQFVIQPTSNVDNKPSIQVTRESPLELWLQTPEGQQLLTSITSVNPSFKPESPDMIRLLSVIKHYFPTAGDILTLANPKNSPVLLNYIKQLGNRFGANPSALGDLNKYLKGLSKQPLVYFEELGPKDPQTSQNTIHLSKLIFGDLSKTVKIGSHILGDIHGLLRKGVKDVKDWLLQLRETNPRFVEGSPDQQKLISWLNYYFGSPENVNTFVQSPQSAEVLKILKGVGGLDKPEDVISLHLLLSKLSGRPVLNEGPIQVVQPSTNQQIIVVQNDYNKWLQSPVGQDLLLKIQQTNPAIATGPGSQQLISLLRHYFPSTTDLEKFIKTPNFNVFLQFLPSLGGNLQTQPQNTQTIINYLQQITGRPAADVQQLLLTQVNQQQQIQLVQRPTQVLVQRPAQFVLTRVAIQPSTKVTAGSPFELWLQTQEGQQFLASITSVNPSFTSSSSDMVKLLSVIKHYFPTAGDILTLANPTNSPALLNYVKKLGNSFGANPSQLGDLNKYLKSLSTRPLVYFEELGPTESPPPQVIYVNYQGQAPKPGETIQVNGQSFVIG